MKKSNPQNDCELGESILGFAEEIEKASSIIIQATSNIKGLIGVNDAQIVGVLGEIAVQEVLNAIKLKFKDYVEKIINGAFIRFINNNDE